MFFTWREDDHVRSVHSWALWQHYTTFEMVAMLFRTSLVVHIAWLHVFHADAMRIYVTQVVVCVFVLRAHAYAHHSASLNGKMQEMQRNKLWRQWPKLSLLFYVFIFYFLFFFFVCFLLRCVVVTCGVCTASDCVRWFGVCVCVVCGFSYAHSETHSPENKKIPVNIPSEYATHSRKRRLPYDFPIFLLVLQILLLLLRLPVLLLFTVVKRCLCFRRS